MLKINDNFGRSKTWFIGEPFNFSPDNISSIEANGRELREIYSYFSYLIPGSSNLEKECTLDGNIKFHSEGAILAIQLKLEELYMRKPSSFLYKTVN